MSAEPPGDFLFRYTRADALRDGVLLDITATAKEHADLKVQTAITLRLWRALAGHAPFRAQDERVKDLCRWLLFAAIGLIQDPGSDQDTLRSTVLTGGQHRPRMDAVGRARAWLRIARGSQAARAVSLGDFPRHEPWCGFRRLPH